MRITFSASAQACSAVTGLTTKKTCLVPASGYYLDAAGTPTMCSAIDFSGVASVAACTACTAGSLSVIQCFTRAPKRSKQRTAYLKWGSSRDGIGHAARMWWPGNHHTGCSSSGSGSLDKGGCGVSGQPAVALELQRERERADACARDDLLQRA